MKDEQHNITNLSEYKKDSSRYIGGNKSSLEKVKMSRNPKILNNLTTVKKKATIK
jgi:hypothetical protein